VARDAAGNVETKPVAAEATTFVAPLASQSAAAASTARSAAVCQVNAALAQATIPNGTFNKAAIDEELAWLIAGNGSKTIDPRTVDLIDLLRIVSP